MTLDDYEEALTAGAVESTLDLMPIDKNTNPTFQRIGVNHAVVVLQERPLTFEEWQKLKGGQE